MGMIQKRTKANLKRLLVQAKADLKFKWEDYNAAVKYVLELKKEIAEWKGE